jgi:hypothetical protein
MKKTKIVCYLSTGCTSESMLKKNIKDALILEGLKAEVKFLRVDNARASNLKLRGSPSVFINGIEVQPINIEGFS